MLHQKFNKLFKLVMEEAEEYSLANPLDNAESISIDNTDNITANTTAVRTPMSATNGPVSLVLDLGTRTIDQEKLDIYNKRINRITKKSHVYNNTDDKIIDQMDEQKLYTNVLKEVLPNLIHFRGSNEGGNEHDILAALVKNKNNTAFLQNFINKNISNNVNPLAIAEIFQNATLDILDANTDNIKEFDVTLAKFITKYFGIRNPFIILEKSLFKKNFVFNTAQGDTESLTTAIDSIQEKTFNAITYILAVLDTMITLNYTSEFSTNTNIPTAGNYTVRDFKVLRNNLRTLFDAA